MGRNTVPDPDWKTGPPEPKHTHSDHDIWDDDFGEGDFDGFGVDEAEMVDGEPLITLQESAWCGREGCDAQYRRRMLFTTDTLTDDELRSLKDAAPYEDELGAYVWDNVKRVGPDEIEVIADGERIVMFPEETIEDKPSPTCHGRPPEPSYEPHGL